MKINTFLKLGRISNLPTIWTNCLAGAFLSNNFILDYRFFYLLGGISALYISGMFLNDAFDSQFDQKNRPDRPIASGEVTVLTVFAWGILIMLLGLSAILFASIEQLKLNGLFAAFFLSVLIVIYDWKHKNNFMAPIVMGMCRSMTLLISGLIYSPFLNFQLGEGALFMFTWTVGLTLLAKREYLDTKLDKWPLLFLLLPLIYVATAVTTLNTMVWLYVGLLSLVIAYTIFLSFSRRSIRKMQLITLLIASFSLIDGLLLAMNGFESAAMIAGAMTLVTLSLQKFISGT